MVLSYPALASRPRSLAIVLTTVIASVNHCRAFVAPLRFQPSVAVGRVAWRTPFTISLLRGTKSVAQQSSRRAGASHLQGLAMGPPPPLGAGEKVVIVGGGIGEKKNNESFRSSPSLVNAGVRYGRNKQTQPGAICPVFVMLSFSFS